MLETVLPVCFQSAETLQARREWHDRFRVMKGETYNQEYHLVRLSFWRRQWHPTPVLLPGKSHGWRSLEGCGPWGRWGSDTTEQLHFHFPSTVNATCWCFLLVWLRSVFDWSTVLHDAVLVSAYSSVSQLYVYRDPSLVDLPPPRPSRPCGSSQSAGWSSAAASHCVRLTHGS